MRLYESYLHGETKQVYDQIEALGQNAFLPEFLPEIEKVLTETFRRVSLNLTVIRDELNATGYQLGSESGKDYEWPLLSPDPAVEKLLSNLRLVVNPYGFVPLSLQYFYRQVGACNFGWDYNADDKIRWKLADPIQVTPLGVLLNELDEGAGLDLLGDEYEDNGFASLPLAADKFHKDDISGGDSYSIQITKAPSIDSFFFNEPHNTTFINYLRVCFEDCGFPGIEKGNADFENFRRRVKPKLQSI